MREASKLFDAYRARKPVQPVDFAAFALTKINNVGSHTIPR